MNNTTSLLDNLLAFDIKINDEDIYVPSTQQSTSTNATTINDFIIYSQNVHKNNVTVHTILSQASTISPPADIILIQEPYYAKIGVNPQMAQGNPIYDVFGSPKHPD